MEKEELEFLELLMMQYGKRKHPLEYKNRYQLLVMIILSSQVSDRNINKLAPSFFEVYPSISSLKKATPEELHTVIHTVMNFGKKADALVKMAQMIDDDDKIPRTMAELIKLPAIGRKSANIVIRESGDEAEGILVDLHVVRVAPRIGIAIGDNPEKIEKQLMQLVPRERWNEIGMSLSFLGREICRPTDPDCKICVMNKVCNYYNGTLN
jgi:endonuclease-3